MYLVGLTGGVGSGKSTVAARLTELGAQVVDADAIAREVVVPGQPALAEIAARFDGVVVDGHLDRVWLAAIVFADPQARADLEAITHPRIHARIDAVVSGLRQAWSDQPAPRIVVLDHPLLVETGEAAHCDAVVVVEAAEDARVERLVAGRGYDADDARARMTSQAGDDDRRAAATYVLDNDGDVGELVAQVDALWTDLVAAAADARDHGAAMPDADAPAAAPLLGRAGAGDAAANDAGSRHADPEPEGAGRPS